MKVQPHNNLGRYCVEREIGRGAMGVVYSARDPKIDRTVAIKTISFEGQDPADEAEFRERFLLEARAAGRLSHSGLVTIFDAGEDPETHVPYIVMEFVRGQPLSKILREAGGKLDLDASLRFALEIAEALAYAHAQGVVHGDIKPANILITDDGHAKIADFGVARLNGLIRPGGKIFGSPAYMAPEQLSGSSPDARSDLFSLGVVLYSMLTGFRPFQGNSAHTVSFKVMNFEPVPVSSFQAELQPELDRIVSRAIAKEPRDRYQNGAEMARDIRSFMHTPPGPDDTSTLYVRRERALQTRSQAKQPSSAASRTLVWQIVSILVLTATILGGVQASQILHERAVISMPVFPSPAAPAVRKTPALAAPIHKLASISKPAAVPPVVENARLRVEILHHFSTGKATLSLDGNVVLDQDLSGDDQRHPVFRALEMNQIASVMFKPGHHTLQIHVADAGSGYDQSEQLEGDFKTDVKRVLIVNCDKKKMQMNLR